VVWSFTTLPPLPGQASTPSPADAATDVSLTAPLGWTAGSDATSHDVYFGTNPTPGPAELQGNQAGLTFDPGPLSDSTTYYWRIDEVNVAGTTTGVVWSFTTVPPLPGQASTPSPADAATDVALNATLGWTAGSDATSHDVYFGTNPTPGPGELQGNQAGTTFDPGPLASSTTYYWRIDEVNAAGTTAGVVWSFTTVAPGSNVTGQWDFVSADLSATIGTDLSYLNGNQAGTQFGTTATFGIPDIAGQTAQVMFFPAYNRITEGIEMLPGIEANGGGTLVNQYTIVMDFLRPAQSDGQWQALYNTNPANSDDADLYINRSNAIGTGQYHGSIAPDQWYRIAWVVDTVAGTISKYVDGTFIGVSNTNGVDGLWALPTATDGLPTLLFTTSRNRRTAPGYVSSIQIREGVLSAAEIGALGGASASGIPSQ
jgi:hypothetical protein